MTPPVPDADMRDITPPPLGVSNLMILDTPGSTPETQTRSYPAAELGEKRRAICTDASPVTREVSVDYFLGHVLPSLHPKIKLPAVIQKLKKNKTIRSGRFMSFSKDPVHKSGHETKIFAPIETIASKMVQAATSKGMKPTVKFFSLGDVMPISKRRKWRSKPDCIFVRAPCKRTDRHAWPQIVGAGEYKPDDDEKKYYDDVLKVMGSMQHCLCEDITRRFTYGLTIENSTMRMWFATRAFVLLSKGFNFITDHTTTAHFFLSLAFAPEPQLGCDPTINRVPNQEDKFDIVVFSAQSEPRTFRTQELVSDRSVDTMNGPGIRTWRVQEVLEGEATGSFFTLKDSWVEEDRLREGDVLQELLAALPSDKTHGRVIDKYFTHIVCYGDVQLNGQPDSTQAMLRGAPFPPESAHYPIIPPQKESGVGTPAQKGARGDPETAAEQSFDVLREATLPPVTPISMIHHRMVCTDLYQPLYKYTDFRIIFFSLSMVCIPIQAMHEAGFVHRNLSTESIVVDDSNGVRLIGLHHAKRINCESAAHPGRIAPLDFMAVEVRNRTYMFDRATSEEDKDELPTAIHAHRDKYGHTNCVTEDTYSDDAASSLGDDPTDGTDASDYSFLYNPLHDLESVWWLAVYFLLKREAVINGSMAENSTEAERQIRDLFGRRTGRVEFFRNDRDFKKLASVVHPVLRPAVARLDEIRKHLIRAYQTAEQEGLGAKAVTIDVSKCTLYDYMGLALQKIADISRKANIILRPRVQDKTDDDSTAEEDPSEALDLLPVLTDKTNGSSAPRGQKRSREDEPLETEVAKKLKATGV
ncbi:hypothetical protein EIP86_010380 [Pleurotus ostreatoroseus]|nr:hypothetical protein EIP86_010380 [Pleurotus ostreatoroseus]